MDKKKYLEDLGKRQKEHLGKVFKHKENMWQPCLHDKCTFCHGTGITVTNQPCMHMLSCNCPKCSHVSM
jgi:hypothetical protein